MVVVYLRGDSKILPTSSQHSFIIEYANRHNLTIDTIEIDNSPSLQPIDDRELLQNTLLSLKEGDTVLIYDLWVFSKNVDELVKVFDCILRHNLIVHICNQELVVGNEIPAGVLMSILCQQREKNLAEKKSLIGRPKGSFSKSKFDKYKSQIINMIEQKLSTSQIAKKLEVSRSSLKDYINSRSLKDIAELKTKKYKEPNYQKLLFKLPDPDECPLIELKIKKRG